MSSPAVQLSFTLRTSPNVRTVHLLGSWDHYKSQLPLSAVKDGSAKPGSWKGTFRFQGSNALKLGSRYWYYYIVDGYHVSHDPAKDWVTEKTTGRKVNIIDVPGGDGRASKPAATAAASVSGGRYSREIPQGRALSPGKILHPKPGKPYASRTLREADYDRSPIDDLDDRFANYRISGGNSSSASPSELSDDSSSTGVHSRSSPSSLSTISDRSCRCERYGVTRSGQRVKLDCGGKRCGSWSSSSSECTESDGSSGDERARHSTAHRNGDRRGAPATISKASYGSAGDRRKSLLVDKRRR